LVIFKGIGMLASRRSLIESAAVTVVSAIFAWVVFHCAQLGEHQASTSGAEDPVNSNLQDDPDDVVDLYPVEPPVSQGAVGNNGRSANAIELRPSSTEGS